MPVRPPNYIIYGSGDRGTLELRGIFTERDIPYTFIDIRRAGRKGRNDPMFLLGQHHLTTVPQVFTLDGKHIGNFEMTIAYLDGAILDPDVA